MIESFNGRFRDECLNTQVFVSLHDARQTLSVVLLKIGGHRRRYAQDTTPSTRRRVQSSIAVYWKRPVLTFTSYRSVRDIPAVDDCTVVRSPVGAYGPGELVHGRLLCHITHHCADALLADSAEIVSGLSPTR